MSRKTLQTFLETEERLSEANKEDLKMALQIVNTMAEKNITSYNAKIILNLCHDFVEINSKIVRI